MHPDLIVGDVGPKRSTEIFEALEERGLVVLGHKVEALVEEKAQERLLALRQEHGV